MPRLEWDVTGERVYETGVDRGVLYVPNTAGVAWNGLTSVAEKPSGGDNKSYFMDGEKYYQEIGSEDYAATLTAFTYPDEFDACEGMLQSSGGMFLTSQPRQSFGFTYRTHIGSDVTSEAGYKIHIVYNALASPSDRSNVTLAEQVNPLNFSWDIETVPLTVDGFRGTAHVVIDSRKIRVQALSDIEDILYGSVSDDPRLPLISELATVIDTYGDLIVTDYGDGTATISGVGVTELDANTYNIDWPSVVSLDANTYRVTSS